MIHFILLTSQDVRKYNGDHVGSARKFYVPIDEITLISMTNCDNEDTSHWFECVIQCSANEFYLTHDGMLKIKELLSKKPLTEKDPRLNVMEAF